MQGKNVSQCEFETHALDLLGRVEKTGESIIVTDHGKGVLEVRPYHGVERKPLDMLRGSVLHYESGLELPRVTAKSHYPVDDQPVKAWTYKCAREVRQVK
jgi:antitoxin (DNA-binding transcriptional repressor) of toxin-antitoxin stability system